MKTKVFAAILALIFMVSAAAATTISEEEVTIDLSSNTVEVKMEVEDLTTNSFNYQTKYPVSNLRGFFNGEEASCTVDNLPLGSNINCETDLKENFTARLEYSTQGLVTREGNNIQRFNYNQSIYRPVRNYTLRVLLPEGTGLADQSNETEQTVLPEGADIDNLNGRRFVVEWNTNPELGEVSFQILFEGLESRNSLNFLPIVLGGIILSLIAIGVYRRKNLVNASSIIEELENDQKMVVEMLRDNNGEMLQKDIVDESDYSKAKISGVVKELEDRNIISKEKEGRSNKVVLKNKFMR